MTITISPALPRVATRIEHRQPTRTLRRHPVELRVQRLEVIAQPAVRNVLTRKSFEPLRDEIDPVAGHTHIEHRGSDNGSPLIARQVLAILVAVNARSGY